MRLNLLNLAFLIPIWASALSNAVAETVPSSPPKPQVTWEVINRFPLLNDVAFKDLTARWTRANVKSMADFIVPGRMSGNATANGAFDRFLLVDPAKAVKKEYQSGWVPTGGAVDIVVTVRGATQCYWGSFVKPLLAENSNGCVVNASVLEDQLTTLSVRTDVGDVSVAVHPKSIVIAVIGDSYAAGEGSPDGPATYADKPTPPEHNDWIFDWEYAKKEGLFGAPVAWWDPVCHRSLLSWPVLSSLRIAMQKTHHVVHLADVSCSGAEFFDGVFIAQSKPNAIKNSPGLSNIRDGTGPRYVGPSDGANDKFVRLSQIDAVQELLCPQSSGRTYPELEDLDGKSYTTSQRACKSPFRAPDFLLLSIGGNDIGFSKAVTGVVVPDNVRHRVWPMSLLSKTGLFGLRNAAGVISMDKLATKAELLSKNYRQYLEHTITGALKPTSTILLKYPNPIGTNKDGCVKGTSDMRVRNSYMTMGMAMSRVSPIGKSLFDGWVAEIRTDEVQQFIGTAYPAIKSLQESLPFGVIGLDWLPESESSFTSRLLCEESESAEPPRPNEPYFFCQQLGSEKLGATADECAVRESGTHPWIEVETERRKVRLADWHYQAANRRFVNSMNDSFLAQRRWPTSKDKPQPSIEDINDAMSGTFHPTPEAYAVAADSVYSQMSKVAPKDADEPD